MKKNLKIYYGLLAAAVLAQILITVFSLSQNIGYGQKISFLENKKHTLENQANLLKTQLAQKVAIGQLEQKENGTFVAIADVIVVDRESASLALK